MTLKVTQIDSWPDMMVLEKEETGGAVKSYWDLENFLQPLRLFREVKATC